MKSPAVLDLNGLVDGQRLGRGSILVLLVALLALVSDGFDLAAMGYVAPELVKQWHIAPARLVPTFSAGIIGMLFGAPLLGYLGDRYGRKIMVVGGLAAIGALTLLTTQVRGLPDLVVLRFLTGLGLGGVIPNVIALVAEAAPRRVRGRMIVIVTIGVVVGISLPGLIAATLVARYGWQVLLVFGGVLPILIALATLAVVPESIKYLVQRGDRDDEARRIARRLRPDLTISEATRFTYPAAVHGGSPRRLFLGDFAAVTPLLWICQAANQMANFFALTWLPTLLQSTGASTAQAGANAALFSVGGLVSGLLLVAVIDSFGVVPLVLMFLFGAPLIAGIGMTHLSPGLHGLIIAGAGFCVVGVQCGITALLGIFYPTPIRSMGTGWTQAAGRVGAVAAPIVGGILLDSHLSVGDMLLAPAGVLLVGAAACAVLAWLCRRRFGGLHPEEFPLADSPSAIDLPAIAPGVG